MNNRPFTSVNINDSYKHYSSFQCNNATNNIAYNQPHIVDNYYDTTIPNDNFIASYSNSHSTKPQSTAFNNPHSLPSTSINQFTDLNCSPILQTNNNFVYNHSLCSDKTPYCQSVISNNINAWNINKNNTNNSNVNNNNEIINYSEINLNNYNGNIDIHNINTNNNTNNYNYNCISNNESLSSLDTNSTYSKTSNNGSQTTNIFNNTCNMSKENIPQEYVTLYKNVSFPIDIIFKNNRWYCPMEECKSINRSYKSKLSLINHYIIHTPDKLVCPYENCNKYFSFKRVLQQHLRTHTKERPYKCKFKGCNKSFAQAGSRTRHERIHTQVKPYKCKICNRGFNVNDNRLRHEKTHDINRKIYFCTCGKQFRSKSGFNGHKKTCNYNGRDIKLLQQQAI